jgi:Tripartite tricarboxylate transporter TctB family
MTWLKIEKPLFTLFIAGVLAGAVQVARGWSIRASIIILVLGGIGLALAVAQLFSDIKTLRSEEPAKVLTMEAPALESYGRWGSSETWAWILGFYAIIHLVGFPLAVPLFVFSYTKVYGGGWLLSALLAVVSWGFVYSLFDVLLHVPWPEPIFSVMNF